MTHAAAARRGRWSLVALVLSDLFLGIAAGLLGYYALTNLVTYLQQRELNVQLAVPAEAEVQPGPTMDFEGWETEDKAYWTALHDGGAFGRIVIATLTVDVVVVKGVDRDDLKRGPGWIPWTSLPGPSGTSGISGHRTTYLHPFRDIDRLKPGDTIQFYSPFRRYTYKVKRVLVVRPWEVDVVKDTATPMLALTACHPPLSAAFRIVAQADLTEVRRLARPSGEPAQ